MFSFAYASTSTSYGCGCEDCDSKGPLASRPLSSEEVSTAKAVSLGSGVTSVAWTLAGTISVDIVKSAAASLASEHPMFTARVVKNPKTAVLELHICQTPKSITVVERSWDDVEGVEGDEGEEDAKKKKEKTLMLLLEADLNVPFNERPDGPNDLIKFHVYPAELSTTITMQAPISVLDRMSVRAIGSKFLKALADASAGKEAPPLPETIDSTVFVTPFSSIVPQEHSSAKSLLSQAYDALSYVRSSLAMAMLPFEPGVSDITLNKFRTSMAALQLSKSETDAFLHACEKREVSPCAAECAALLKATAAVMELGSRTEAFNLSILHDCRDELDDSAKTTPFAAYVSMIPVPIPVTEEDSLWELAQTVNSAYDEAVALKKHFTDISVLETLFAMAMRTPAATRGGAMRTSLCSTHAYSPFEVDWQEAAGKTLTVEASLGPTVNVHGPGPCLSYPDVLQDGSLSLYFMYPTPLFSRVKMESLACSVKKIIVDISS